MLFNQRVGCLMGVDTLGDMFKGDVERTCTQSMTTPLESIVNNQKPAIITQQWV